MASILRSELLAGLLLAGATLVACERDNTRPAPARPAAGPLQSPVADAGTPDASATDDDLAAQMRAFTTSDACVQRGPAIGAILGDDVEPTDQGTMERDVCYVIDAAKAGDARRCQPIVISSLRAQCVATVAEVAATPDACPFFLADRPDLGRDPVCVALASRDERLCGAAREATARAACTAVTTRDPAACNGLPPGAEQTRCALEQRRWASVIPAAPPHPPLDLQGHWTAKVEGDEVTMIEGGWELDVSRGVVLVERRDGTHIVFGAAPPPADIVRATPPSSVSWVRVEVVVPRSGAKARVSTYEFNLANDQHRRFEPGGRTDLHVDIEKLDRRRAGIVQLFVNGSLESGLLTRNGLRSFVRDVVNLNGSQDPPKSDAGRVP